MFNHHHRIAGLHQRVQHFQQFAHIFEMQPGGGLIQNIERAPGGAARQLLGKLDALRFAAR